MVNNAGTQIAEGLRPVVESLGKSFFTNTVTIKTRTRDQGRLGEVTYSEENLYENIPAMIVKAALNAGIEEELQGDLETATKIATVTLGGYFPDITLEMSMTVDQDGLEYDILGIDHPATAMTQLVVERTDPQGLT